MLSGSSLKQPLLLKCVLVTLALMAPVRANQDSVIDGAGDAAPDGEELVISEIDITDPEFNIAEEYIVYYTGQYEDEQGFGEGDASVLFRWNALQAITFYDATAPYHETAVGVYSDLGRRPASESEDNENINVAMLYAAFRLFSWMGKEDPGLWVAMVEDLGYNSTDNHEGTDDPIGIGNAAGNAVVKARMNDGYNTDGLTDGRKYNAAPFSDPTGYRPVNTAYDLHNAHRWQPDLLVDEATGIQRVQAFVTPQYRITESLTFNLHETPDRFKTPRPDKSYDVGGDGTPGELYRAQADEVLAISAELSDEAKILAELFDQKGRSLGSAISQQAEGMNLTVVERLHFDFVMQLSAWETGIAVWHEKTRWDAVRPFTAVRYLYPDEELTAYGGPDVAGTVDDITGTEWQPYMQSADHPEYPSASASFCAAFATMVPLWQDGVDSMSVSYSYVALTSNREPSVTPATDLNFSYSTWAEWAEVCGQSRVWAGVHFPDAVPAGQAIGRAVAPLVWQFYQDHLTNTGSAGVLHGHEGSPVPVTKFH